MKILQNQNLSSGRALAWQKFSYRTGEALKGHVASSHKGIFNKSCNACVELLKKQKEAQRANT